MAKIINQLVLVFGFCVSNILINSFVQQYTYLFLLPVYAGIVVNSIALSIIPLVFICVEALIFKGTLWAPLIYLGPITLSAFLLKDFIHIKHRYIGTLVMILCLIAHNFLLPGPAKSLSYYTFFVLCGMIIIVNLVFDIFVEGR